MKKRLLFVTLMLMTGILLAQPGHGNKRNDHHKKDYNQHNQGKKVIVVKPHQPKLVLRFNVDPYGRYHDYRSQRNYTNSSRRYNSNTRYSDNRNRQSYSNNSNRYDSRSHYSDNRRNYRVRDLEVVRRRDVDPLMDRLDRYYERGLIDKKEYHYAREELREMVGKMYPKDYAEEYVEEVIEQIADLHRLRRRGMISSYEYARYKTELLKML